MKTIMNLATVELDAGSKASNLARVTQLGYRVPAGFCIAAAAYHEYVRENGLEPAIMELSQLDSRQLEEAADRLQNAFREGTLPPRLRQEILSAYHTLIGSGSPTVAVRSSATTEDLAHASAAGQQDTYLHVSGDEELVRAVIACWASLWSLRAIRYRAGQGQSQLPAMAVIVQRMLNPQAAGVAFSVDPSTSEQNVVIEATRGLGDCVAAGQVDADRYVVPRSASCPVASPCLETGEGILTRAQALEIAQAVLDLERDFGQPVDVEWAIENENLYILQCRPVTTDWSSYYTDLVPDEQSVWTSGFLNERFSAPVSPLGWSVIRELLEELAFRDPLRYLGVRHVQEPLTRLYRGHPYVNLFVFQTLYKVFPEALLPEDARRYFPNGETSLRHEVRYPRSLLDPHMIVSMLRHLAGRVGEWSPWHNHHAWARFAVQHERSSRELQQRLDALQSTGKMEDIKALLCDAQALNRQLLDLHRWSLTHADLSYSLLRRLLNRWLPLQQAADLCVDLVVGQPNKSVEMNEALCQLASHRSTPAFDATMECFLARFGHRSFHLDLYYPTFGDDPTQVSELLDKSPAIRDDRSRQQPSCRNPGEQLARALQGSRLAGAKRRVLLHLVQLARHYMALREEQRFYWQSTLALMRRAFLLLGARLHDCGRLDEAAQIFFLTKDEVEQCVADRECCDYRMVAERRRAEFERLTAEFRSLPNWSYPAFLRGNRPLPLDTTRDGEWQGRPISPGLATGRAVLVFSPAQFSRVRPGDILVARSIDPGWTPLFQVIAGLILEHGGQLSHGAVVAREYRLPAVSGIAAITECVQDGDLLAVDGTNGLVRVLNTGDHG